MKRRVGHLGESRDLKPHLCKVFNNPFIASQLLVSHLEEPQLGEIIKHKFWPIFVGIFSVEHSIHISYSGPQQPAEPSFSSSRRWARSSLWATKVWIPVMLIVLPSSLLVTDVIVGQQVLYCNECRWYGDNNNKKHNNNNKNDDKIMMMLIPSSLSSWPWEVRITPATTLTTCSPTSSNSAINIWL